MRRVCELKPGGFRRLAHGLVVVAMLALATALIVPPSAFASPQSSASSQSQAKKKTKRRSHARRDPGQKAPTTDRIGEIQSALAREGYYKGDPSGKWDADTQDAMRRFQEEHGLSGNGKLDAPSLQKLGLGSDIAGVSAPRPPQPPSEQTKPASPSASGSAMNAPPSSTATSRP